MSNINVTVKDGNNIDVTVSTRGTQIIKIDRGVSSSGGGGSVTNVTANTPLSVTNGTTTPDLSIAQATGSTAGYLTASDWATFNSKVSTVSGTAPVTVTGTTSPTISMAAATDSVSGYLTSTDHTTFNAKVGSITSADSSITVTGTTTRDLSVANSPNVIVQVRNNTGATLTKGTAVYINGAIGQLPTVTKAQANSDAASAQTLGLMTTDLANNANGYVTIIGLITNINTLAYTDGQQLYLSPTVAGGLTATKPSAPQHLVYVAVVEYAHITQGKLFVKVQNGYELDELHDVQIISPANGQTLTYDSATSLWKNTTPAASGVTSVSGTGTVSGISLSGTVTSIGSLTLGGSLNLSSPPAIGGTTPNAITGTTVSATTIMTLPTVTPGNAGAGVLQMVDGGDGYDYLNIFSYDAVGSSNYAVNFPGGLSATGNIASGGFSTTGNVIGSQFFANGDGTYSGSILINDSLNSFYIGITAPTTLTTNYTLTLPTTAGSANQVLKTDGSGNLSWTTQGVQAASNSINTIISATYTVATNDQYLICNRSGTVTLTLPNPNTNICRSLNIKTISANTVVSASSNVVQRGNTTVSTAILAATAGTWATLVSDGTNWVIMAGN